jgi:SH3-like domain-containing protein
MRSKVALIAMLGGLLAAVNAQALDFVSVATPAIMYDAPSLKAKKLFVATRYLPLERVVSLDNWIKVRDHYGKMYWIEKRALSGKRFVLVTAQVAAVREKPEEGAAVVFQAARQLAMEWQANAGNGWLKVRDIDGATGYVKITDVWGD